MYKSSWAALEITVVNAFKNRGADSLIMRAQKVPEVIKVHRVR